MDNDLDKVREHARMKGWSVNLCEICKKPITVRDLRKTPLCSECARLSNALDWAKNRYLNFQKGALTDKQKQALQSVRSHGPYFRNKQP